MTLIVVVAATHYVVALEETIQIERDMSCDSNASEGVNILYNPVTKAYGGLPVFVLKPQYISLLMIQFVTYLTVLLKIIVNLLVARKSNRKNKFSQHIL